MTSKRICIYCASSDLCDKKHLNAGRQLGDALARMDVTVVYGGANKGVMGAVADGALNAKGKVIGWIPTFMPTETLHPGLKFIKKDIRKRGEK
jgi:predicted Rossmann-fold nucleotide-binding protein